MERCDASDTSGCVGISQVSEASFVRAMDASGIGLTREELGLVINRYKIPEGGGAVNYQKFCDQSNKVEGGGRHLD